MRYDVALIASEEPEAFALAAPVPRARRLHHRLGAAAQVAVGARAHDAHREPLAARRRRGRARGRGDLPARRRAGRASRRRPRIAARLRPVLYVRGRRARAPATASARIVVQSGPKWLDTRRRGRAPCARVLERLAPSARASSPRRAMPPAVARADRHRARDVCELAGLGRRARGGAAPRDGRHRRRARRGHAGDARRRRLSRRALRGAGAALAAVGIAVPRVPRLRGGRRSALPLDRSGPRWLLSARCWSRPAGGSATRSLPAWSRARSARGTRRSTRWCCPRTPTSRRTCRRSTVRSRWANGCPRATTRPSSRGRRCAPRCCRGSRAFRCAPVKRAGCTRVCSRTASSCAASWATAPRTGRRSCSTTPARSAATLPDAAPEFVVRDDERAAAAALLRVHDVAGPYHVLHPTRGLSAQRARWPIAGFVALARRLVARDGVPVLVTGARDDEPIAHAIADGARQRRDGARGRDDDRHVRRVGAARARRRRDGFGADARRGGGRRADGRASSRCSPTSRTAGRPRDRASRSCGRRYPCPPGHRKETCPDFACVRDLDEAAILAALDGLLVATAER